MSIKKMILLKLFWSYSADLTRSYSAKLAWSVLLGRSYSVGLTR